MPGLMATKIGMTRIFSSEGSELPVTIVKLEPNKIIHIKTLEKDGYSALVLGFRGLKKPSKVKKFKFVKEFKVDDGEVSNYEKGGEVSIDLFKEGDRISLTGFSKGRGFSGVMKKWNFHGQPDSHGHTRHRTPGSVGCRAKPGRIQKGKKLPGRFGSDKVTTQGREVVMVDSENLLLAIKGEIPGANNNVVFLKK